MFVHACASTPHDPPPLRHMHPVRRNRASLRKFVDLADVASYLRIQPLTIGPVPAPVISPRSFRQRGPHRSDSNTCRGGNAMSTKARVDLRVALDSRPKTETRSPRNRRPRRRDVWPGVAAPEPSRRRGADSSGSGDFQPNTQMRMDAAMVFNWWQDDAEPSDRGTNVQDIIDRVQAEWRASRRRPTGWPHAAPDRPLSVEEAHATMQQHRGCRATECPRKETARQTLIDGGRMKPDTSRES